MPADLGMLASPVGNPAPDTRHLPYREAREHFEREYFAAILKLADGNVSEAARLSGLARQNFYNHIEPLGLASNS
jgi:DNA-binding NtrC family response regulator